MDIYKKYPPLSRVKVINKDICIINGEELLKGANIRKDDIYLFAGCPPCQNFSRQNPHNKDKTDEERKKLLFEFLRIIEEIYPPFILMENVPRIESDFNQNILSEFLTRLNDKYYIVRDILNAADYGVPQIRKRFVLHAVRKDINIELKQNGFNFGLPDKTHDRDEKNGLRKWKTVKEAIGDLPRIAAGETYADNGVIHNHKCANLSDINLQRIKIIRKNGGSRNGLPEDLVLNCHKRKDEKGSVFSGHGDVYGIRQKTQKLI